MIFMAANETTCAGRISCCHTKKFLCSVTCGRRSKPFGLGLALALLPIKRASLGVWREGVEAFGQVAGLHSLPSLRKGSHLLLSHSESLIIINLLLLFWGQVTNMIICHQASSVQDSRRSPADYHEDAAGSRSCQLSYRFHNAEGST